MHFVFQCAWQIMSARGEGKSCTGVVNIVYLIIWKFDKKKNKKGNLSNHIFVFA